MNKYQEDIVANLGKRGYPVGVSPEDAAKQAMKLLEEAIELHKCGTVDAVPQPIVNMVKYLFDNKCCGTLGFDNRVYKEICDVIVTLCSTCYALGLDIEDMFAAAVEKSGADISRGVRKET